MATAAQGNILFVAHGPGRGRDVPTGTAFFARLCQTDPAMASRIVVHETGSPAPSLAGIALIVFWLGDPLRQKYPACFREAEALCKAALRRGIPVLNTPQGLSNTSKSIQSEIWEAAGIPSARVRCLTTRSDLSEVFSQMGGACLLRGNETHAERDICVVRSPKELEQFAPGFDQGAAFIRIHDIRAEYRAAGVSQNSLYSRFHHKARTFVFRGEVKASHLFFSKNLIVGLSTSLLEREARPRRAMIRKLGLRRTLFEDMIAEDLRFYQKDIPYKDVLTRAVAALGLDFAAVDYSIRPDGTPIIWEANPYFCLPPGEESVLSEERGAVARVNESFDWMAHCLTSALPERLAS